jgi:hypothetical protein
MSGFVRFVVIIGVVLAMGSFGLGWWALPILVGLVVAEAWIRGGPEERAALQRRLLSWILVLGVPILALSLVSNWLFDGYGAFLAFMGPIFAFWAVFCVILPTWRARRLKPQE